jgi:hypothetical protein
MAASYSIPDNREKWIVKNVSNNTINIGDIPDFPVLSKGQSFDVLDGNDKDVVLQSKNLVYLVNIGWLTLTKTNDGNNLY